MPFSQVKTFAEGGPVLVAFYDSLVEQERRKKKVKSQNNRIKRGGKNGKEMKGKGAQPDRTSVGLFFYPRPTNDGYFYWQSNKLKTYW